MGVDFVMPSSLRAKTDAAQVLGIVHCFVTTSGLVPLSNSQEDLGYGSLYSAINLFVREILVSIARERKNILKRILGVLKRTVLWGCGRIVRPEINAHAILLEEIVGELKQGVLVRRVLPLDKFCASEALGGLESEAIRANDVVEADVSTLTSTTIAKLLAEFTDPWNF